MVPVVQLVEAPVEALEEQLAVQPVEAPEVPPVVVARSAILDKRIRPRTMALARRGHPPTAPAAVRHHQEALRPTLRRAAHHQGSNGLLGTVARTRVAVSDTPAVGA